MSKQKNPATLNAEPGYLVGIALAVFSCISKLGDFGARNRGNQIGAYHSINPWTAFGSAPVV
jgi:hypothetical protein